VDESAVLTDAGAELSFLAGSNVFAELLCHDFTGLC
jgi:hypothetical protein